MIIPISFSSQFLNSGDLCFINGSAYLSNLNTTNGEEIFDCGLPFWNNATWIGGELSMNPIPQYNSLEYLYSYDYFDLLIDRLVNKEYFPNLCNITLFGFSAGAQLIQRYSVAQKYREYEGIQVKFIVSDPSSFAYFDQVRPFTNGTFGFSVPDQSWIPETWSIKVSDDLLSAESNFTNTTLDDDLNASLNFSNALPYDFNASWIDSFDYPGDYNCIDYNYWRYGFYELTGYVANISTYDDFGEIDYVYIDNGTALNPLSLLSRGIQNYINLDMVYMIGFQDVCNCQLSPNIDACYVNGLCDDNNLDVSCSGMIQGDNRYIRMLNWMNYLNYYFQNTTRYHRLVEMNTGHDETSVLSSPQGLCEVFGFNCSEGIFDVINSTIIPSIPFDSFGWL